MSTQLQNNIAYLRAAEHPVQVLFVGASLAAASHAFQRKDEVVRCNHAATIEAAVSLIVARAKERSFDCVMVDMCDSDEVSPLKVVELAALKFSGSLVILASKENADQFRQMVGVHQVLVAPIEPLDLIKAIVTSAPQLAHANGDSATVGQGSDRAGAGLDGSVVADGADATDAAVADDDGAQAPAIDSRWSFVPDQHRARLLAVKTRFSGQLSVAFKALRQTDQGLWQRFVPLANFVYKKLAIIILTALFLTFVAYGAMIIFFMSNSSWSLPFELSRGHVLVEKVERDLSSMRLRRNQIRQDLTSATVGLEKARRDRRDGQLQLELTQATIEHELEIRTAINREIKNDINRLRSVLKDFQAFNGKKGFAKNLRGAYRQRLITKQAYQTGTLAVLETMHRLATVRGEIETKKLDLRQAENNLKFLQLLAKEIEQGEVGSVTSAGADLAHLAREAIRIKTLLANADTQFQAAKLQSERLENSFEVISGTIGSLEATPAARALAAPVTVLFVPYDNTENVKAGEPLYSCIFSFILCSQVGEVGKSVDGETVSVHPLFGKPMRGIFVEAKFEDTKSGTEELVHAGSSPLWF